MMVPFALMIISIFEILNTFMITYKYYQNVNCKRRVQIQDLQGVCAACTRRAYNAHTAL